MLKRKTLTNADDIRHFESQRWISQDITPVIIFKIYFNLSIQFWALSGKQNVKMTTKKDRSKQTNKNKATHTIIKKIQSCAFYI